VIEAQKQTSLLKAQGIARVDEMNDDMAELERKHKQRELVLDRRIAALESELRANQEDSNAVTNLRLQLQEQQTKTQGLQRELEELEQQAGRESIVAANDLRDKIEEAAKARRRAHSVEAQLVQEERLREISASECTALRRERDALRTQVTSLEAQARAAVLQSQVDERPNQEIAQLRATRAAEQEQHTKALRLLEEQHQTSMASARRAEAKVKQLEDDITSREREAEREEAEAGRRHQSEISAIRAEVQKVESEAEAKRQAWREKEASLLRQLSDARSRAECLSDELAQTQLQKEEFRRSLSEAKRQEQQHEQTSAAEKAQLTIELNSQRERAERTEAERVGLSAKADSLSEERRQAERHADALKVELDATNQRHEEERVRYAREADEAHSSAVHIEEQRRAQAAQKMQEDHRRHLAKQQIIAKKAVGKVRKKYEHSRSRCQELAKRVALLQHEKDIAIRICEENKGAYELRLHELGIAVGTAAATRPMASFVGEQGAVLRADSPGVVASRVELRSIADRLERHQEWLRLSRASSIGVGSVASVSEPTRGSILAAGTPRQGADEKVLQEEALRTSSVSNPQGR
jgi:hypothetical protein